MMENLTTKAASAYYRAQGYSISPSTMCIWRCQKIGPVYKKIGNRVYYEKTDLDRFANRKIGPGEPRN